MFTIQRNKAEVAHTMQRIYSIELYQHSSRQAGHADTMPCPAESTIRIMSDRLPIVCLLVLVFSCIAFWGIAHADPYTLVTEDKVKLRVVDWQTSETPQYAGWEALQGAYQVDDTGNLSIPIAGQIKAMGKTTEQVADDIANALAANANLPGKPFVALEVTEHAPIFVTGFVQTPGRYPFETNMTVMKAVSLAGGFVRARDGNAAYFERDRIQAAGDYQAAALKRRDLQMQQARLRAEIAGEQDFAIPPDLAGTPDVEKLKAEETNLMRLRRVESESQVAAADDLSRLYSQEIKSLEAKIVTQTRQISLAQEELDAVSSLARKGLSNNARQFSLDRALADAQSGMLDLEIALTKARQELRDSEREKATIINKQNAENQQMLNATNLAIRKAAVEMQVAQLLGEQAGYSAQPAQVGADAMNLGKAEKTFKVVRRSDDGTYRDIKANETTALLPHDLIEIGVGGNAEEFSSSLPSPASQSVASNVARQDSSSRPDVLSTIEGGRGRD